MPSAQGYRTGSISAERLTEMGGQLDLTIARVEEREYDNKVKLCLFFEDRGQHLPLNQTNLDTVIAAFGDDFDKWSGRRVRLVVRPTEMKGKKVPGVRIEII